MRRYCWVVIVVSCMVFVIVCLVYHLTDTDTTPDAFRFLTETKQCSEQHNRVYYHEPKNNATDFTPVSGDGVYTFNDVCIERENPESELGRRLVVYNARANETRHVTVKSGAYSQHPYWIIHFTTSPVSSRHVIKGSPAFFVRSTCEGNLHHLWEDLLLGLYGSLKAAGWLGKPTVLYNSSPLTHCPAPATFHPLLSALGVKNTLTWYQHEIDGVCYKNAVFGSVFKNIGVGEVESFITKALSINTTLCLSKSITIVQRSTSRRILNVEKLKQSIMETMPTINVQVVEFEKSTLDEQIHMATCTKILAGVQGAGLQWHTFMPRPAGLVEMTWHGWPSIYTKIAHQKCYATRTITAQAPNINWELLEEHFHLHNLTGSEKNRWIGRSSNYHFFDNHNVWKWADVTVDHKEFKRIILDLVHTLGLRIT